MIVINFALVHIIQCFDSRNVLFIIMSQPDPYHVNVTKNLIQDIQKQIWDTENRLPIIQSSNEFSVSGASTYIPLLSPIALCHKDSSVRWVVFIEPHTAVRCDRLLETLSVADQQEDTSWIGYGLSDEEPRMVHHFAEYEELDEDGGFIYPNAASGFAMKMSLVDTLLKHIAGGEKYLPRRKHTSFHFSIDPPFELAQLIYRDGCGPLLTSDRSFCIVAGDQCATYPRQFYSCDSPIPEASIFFAVKTWSSYHGTRAAVVKKTWGLRVSHLLFYSDTTDPSLPSINVGVPNTKKGHCEKTMAILKDAVERVRFLPHIQWIFLADDDTILGIQRLCEVLSCFQGGQNVTVIGERYRYGAWNKATGLSGYDYLTGGGGIAFSIAAAAKLSQCSCPERNDPDDMILGSCAKDRGIVLTHSPLFHQARPQDYPRESLMDRPVSFHRHSSPHPLKVYATWFYHDDLRLKKNTPKDEL